MPAPETFLPGRRGYSISVIRFVTTTGPGRRWTAGVLAATISSATIEERAGAPARIFLPATARAGIALSQDLRMPSEIRVLLIEDNRFLRDGITDILRKQGGFIVDARADDDDSTGQLAELHDPDVILIDLGLEREHSLKLMKRLRERFPEARAIAMDIIPDQSDIVEFVKAGGCGFILKNAPLEDFLSTIKAVAGGATILPALLTKSLFTQIVESVLKSGNTIPDHAIRLTRREKEIVDLISEGMSNKEIAQRLHIATFTVKSHVHNVLEKLELNTRLQIAAFVRDGREK